METKNKRGGQTGNKNAAKEGEAITLLLRFNKEESALLRKAHAYDKSTKPLNDWIRTTAKWGPLDYAQRTIAYYEEDEDEEPGE